jgi:AcrR family transcriptional regulator
MDSNKTTPRPAKAGSIAAPQAVKTKAPRIPKRDPAHYHHGDLRAALLAAAEQVLLERGVEGFTLRECARRAGVSHAAPAHHFGDARGLLTEFAALGYQRMAAMMQAARDAAGDNRRAALTGVGMAYIEFAVLHRAQFSLMFRPGTVDREHPHMVQVANICFDHLQQTLALASKPGAALKPEFMTRVLLAWTSVHGFAALVMDGGLKNLARDLRNPTPLHVARRLAPPMLDQALIALIDTSA